MSVSKKPVTTRTVCVLVESPIGALMVSGDNEAVREVRFSNAPRDVLVRERSRCPDPLRQAARQLDEYFTGKRQIFELPLQVTGTRFQEQVWEALAQIPFGQTISYAELAQLVGRPQAFRAVGQANGANPIPIIVPCHRVIAADGTIGGYGGGVAVKRHLLALEGHR